MRAIGLVLLSIAIMALLLTDADAKRRSSAQGSQAAGGSRSWCATYPGKGISDNCSYSSFNQCYQTVLGLGGLCRPNPFPVNRGAANHAAAFFRCPLRPESGQMMVGIGMSALSHNPTYAPQQSIEARYF